MSRRGLSMPVVVGAPLLLFLAGGAVGWFTTDGKDGAPTSDKGRPLPAVFDDVAPLHPLNDAPNPIDTDESKVIGADAYSDDATAIDVPAGSQLEIPLTSGAQAVAVDPATLIPLPGGADPLLPIPPRQATTADVVAAPSPTLSAVVLETLDANAVATPDRLRVSTPFAAAGAFAPLCDEVQAGSVPDPLLAPAVRPTLAVLVNEPSTIAISGTWADGTPLEKTTMLTLAAYDDEWQRLFAETGERQAIVGCISLPVAEVRQHAVDGAAQLRASVLAISANGQAELNATVTLNVPIEQIDQFFVDRVTITGRGEQRRSDGALYPTVHVHYSFLSDAVVPTGSSLLPAQVRVFGDHAFVEGADCVGWAANQQGVDRTHSGRFSVGTETRNVAGRDRAVTVVDGDVYLDPTLSGGWEGSFCVRLQATDQHGDQRNTLTLRGAPVRSPRTATYDVGVLNDGGESPTDPSIDVTWTSATGDGCTAATLSNGSSAHCAFSARWVPDGIDVLLMLDGRGVVIRIPVNTGYCNPDDPFDVGGGCNSGYSQTFEVPLGTTAGLARVTIQVVRAAAPGALWDDPSNAWSVGSVK